MEQHLELGPQEIFPALAQMLKECRPMFQDFVQAAIQVVLLRQPKIRPQQIRPCAAGKPLPMHSPFTARVNQPIDRQGLQHLSPTSSFPRVRQPLAPKLIQAQLIPQPAAHPARPPLPRTSQRKFRPSNWHPVVGRVPGHCPAGRLQRQFLSLLTDRVEHLGDLRPGGPWAVIDLAQISRGRCTQPRCVRTFSAMLQ